MRITFVSNESVKVHRSTPRCQGLSPSLLCCRGREDERPGVLADLDPPGPNPLADMESGFGPPPFADMDPGGPNPPADMDRGGPNPLAALDRGFQIRCDTGERR